MKKSRHSQVLTDKWKPRLLEFILNNIIYSKTNMLYKKDWTPDTAYISTLSWAIIVDHNYLCGYKNAFVYRT